MWRVAWKGLLGHKLRFALTAFAVVLGVTFVSGAFILTDSMDEAFGDLLETAYGGQDIFVRGDAPVADIVQEQAGSRPTLPEEVVDRVAAVPGVATAVPGVEGLARIIGPDGEPVGRPGPPTFGFAWTDDANPLILREGAPPRTGDQITIDAQSATSTGYTIGDRVPVLLPDGVREFELVGITGFGDADNLLGATIVTFKLRTAQRLFDLEGQVTEVAVITAAGEDVAALRDRIAAELGPGYDVGTSVDQVAEDQAAVSEALSFFGTALLVFAAVALFVGGFIISNTFSIVIAQRQREFALLRAVGASARQIRRTVLVEAIVVGVVAAVAGLLLGMAFASGLQALLDAFGISLPASRTIVRPRTVVAAFAVGLGVTVLSSLAPARRAARIAPVEAMRGETLPQGGGLRGRVLAGAALAVLGVGLLAAGLAGTGPNPVATVGAGAAVTLLGMAVLAPIFAVPVASVLGWIPARMGIAGRLAQGNAGRDRRRTAATASALMIGLGLVTFVTIFAASIQASVNDTLNEQFRADFIVQADAFGAQPVPAGLSRELAAEPAVDALVPIRYTRFLDDDSPRMLAGTDPARLDRVLALEVTDGAVADLAEPDTVLVSVSALEDTGRAVGDDFEVTFASGATVTLRIVGAFEGAPLVGASYLTGLDTMTAHVPRAPDLVLLLAVPDGTLEQARDAVEQIVAAYPGVTVRDQAAFRQQQEDQISQLLGLMMVLLALAIIIALLGITNTLALSVFERTRELGLLRAVGMTRRQVRRMVRWESVIIAIFGALLGLVVGVGFGGAVVAALRDDGISRLVIPGGQLATYVVAAGIAGLLAAAFPAWRASRLDVLQAVTTE